MTEQKIVAECWTCGGKLSYRRRAARVGVKAKPIPLSMEETIYHRQQGHDVRLMEPKHE